MKTLTEYTFYLKMENDEDLTWTGKAEDSDNAFHMARKWSEKRTDNIILDYDHEEGETYQLMTEDEALEQYDQMLDEEEWCRVGGMEFAPSRVLSALDPTAYNCGFSDYTDSLYHDYILVEGYTDN